jgi:hypothetical protein
LAEVAASWTGGEVDEKSIEIKTMGDIFSGLTRSLLGLSLKVGKQRFRAYIKLPAFRKPNPQELHRFRILHTCVMST